MLTEKEAKKKLFECAKDFCVMMRKRRYNQAKYCYDTALKVAVFLELPQNEMEKLFGINGEKGTVIMKGEFPQELVARAYEMTVVRAAGKAP